MASPGDEQPLDIETLLAELANKVERVKVLYEQYFMGIEKIEPQVARKDIQRTMLFLQQQYIRNTGLRFKFNTLLQKWNIYITYWNRVLREIEAGTYTRHLAKAQRAAVREGKALPDELVRKARPPSGTFDTGGVPDKKFLDRDSDTNLAAVRAEGTGEFEQIVPSSISARAPSVRPASTTPPPPAERKTPSGPLPAIPGMSEQELRALHQRYAAARTKAGEGQVSYEALVKSLARQVPAVLNQPGVKSLRFDVSVQNGKAVLKAIPQKVIPPKK